MTREISTACLNLTTGVFTENDETMEADSLEFAEWLQKNASFRVVAGENSYRARKESYTKVDYWYGAKKVNNKVHKRFIGRTEEVTCDRLQQVADNIRQPSARSPLVESQPLNDQSRLTEEIAALKAQITSMQEHLMKLVSMQEKLLA